MKRLQDMRDDSFERRRIVSENNSFDPLWIEFYKKFAHEKGSKLDFIEFNCESINLSELMRNYPFPQDRVKLEYDAELQKLGFDKRISFLDGRSLIIEEKVRYKNYGDIFVERWEDKTINKVGWAWDPKLICDYIAYVIWPTSLCIFINFKELHTHLIENEEVYMNRKQFENSEGGYLSTGPTLSFEEISTWVPDSLFIRIT